MDLIPEFEAERLYWRTYPAKVCATLTAATVEKAKSFPSYVGAFRGSFFFEDRAEARLFAEQIGAKALWVVPPAVEKAQMEDDNNHWVIARDRLFYDRYRYRVAFKSLSDQEVEDLDSWIEHFFGNDDERSYYSYSKSRVLYLDDFTDVFLVTLAYRNSISHIERVILRDEFGDEGRSCGKADFNGCHQTGDGVRRDFSDERSLRSPDGPRPWEFHASQGGQIEGRSDL